MNELNEKRKGSGKETLKARLKRKEPVFGTFVKLNSPAVVEMLGCAGLDFIIVDMEHSTIGFNDVEGLMRAADLSQMSTIVRIPSAAEEHVLHALDAGAQGVQVPGLKRAEEAADVISYGKYYPEGVRGLSFNQRSARYGFIDKDRYMKEKNEEGLFVVHIENKEMVEEVEELCKNPQLDVLFIGPMDLSQSYGIPGKVDSPQVQEAVRIIVSAAEASEKSVGIFVTKEEDLKKYVDLGVRYIVWSSDLGFCTAGVKTYLSKAAELTARP